MMTVSLFLSLPFVILGSSLVWFLSRCCTSMFVCHRSSVANLSFLRNVDYAYRSVRKGLRISNHSIINIMNKSFFVILPSCFTLEYRSASLLGVLGYMLTSMMERPLRPNAAQGMSSAMRLRSKPSHVSVGSRKPSPFFRTSFNRLSTKSWKARVGEHTGTLLPYRYITLGNSG